MLTGTKLKKKYMLLRWVGVGRSHDWLDLGPAQKPVGTYTNKIHTCTGRNLLNTTVYCTKQRYLMLPLIFTKL